MSDALPIRRALVAVADKSNVVEFVRGLVDRGVEVVSTGNTARALRDAGIDVTPVSSVTGFPELLEGRLKTVHPRIHGGILADKRKPSHLAELKEHGIQPFDLVVVNLYPFLETVMSGASASEVIEQIDIGGPAMVRAAAKNFESVGVVVKPDDYGAILYELDTMDGRRSCDMGRTHISEAGCTHRRLDPGPWAEPRSSRARRCPSTTGWTLKLRAPPHSCSTSRRRSS